MTLLSEQIRTGEISTFVVQFFPTSGLGSSCPAQAEAREAYFRPLRPKLSTKLNMNEEK